jgi:hypothetical protein
MYHSSFALLDADVILNDASSFLPADSWVLAVLNSPLFWWYAFRVFPHKKDETIAMDQALISVAPIPTASNELKAAVASYVGEIVQGLTDSQGEWMRLGCDLRSRLGDEAGALALKGARSGARGLLAAVKKVDGLDRALALERVNDLRGVADTLVQAAQGRSRRRRELEVLVSDAVFQAYKLSESDIQMVWDTAPPRTPLAADTDGNSVLSSVQIETE